MKTLSLTSALIMFLSGCLAGTASASEGEQTSQPAPSPTKTYTTKPDMKLSRKCAIYSGVCPMNRRSEVGSYCICNTPSGPIHGVVIP